MRRQHVYAAAIMAQGTCCMAYMALAFLWAEQSPPMAWVGLGVSLLWAVVAVLYVGDMFKGS